MTFQRAVRLVVIAFIGFVVVMVALPALGDNGHGHHHGGGDVDVTTGGIAADNSVSNSVRDSSRAFGFGAGDVDIAQCYRSWSIIVYQDSKPNKLCVAEALDAKGLHEAAARLRCSVKAVREVFDSYDQCIGLNTVTAPGTNAKNLIYSEEIFSDHEEEEEMFHVEQQEMYEDLRASIENLKQQQQQDEAARQRAAREQQQKEQERRDYAQQTLEELEQWK